MSRLRRLDRAILSEGTDTTPIDTDDQEQLIAYLADQNDASLRIFSRVLVFSILVEIPISVFALRRFPGGTRPVALLLVCHVLTLVNCLYEFKPPSSNPRLDSSRSDTRLSGQNIREKVIFYFRLFLSLYGLFGLNIVVLLQLLYQVYSSHRFHVIDTLLFLPLINLIAAIVSRKWYGDVSREIRGLHDLKYKFKTA